MSDSHQLAEHFFRHQSGRLVASLARILGPRHLDLVEDVVQGAFMQALRSWATRGVPDDPAGWLFRVAKNSALDNLRRQRHWSTKIAPHLADGDLEETNSESEVWTKLDALNDLDDDRLRMLCLCCHPSLSEESQVAFALKMACGFSVSEIARALLSNAEAIQRRLTRAKDSLRKASPANLIDGVGSEQLTSVLRVVYLIFNEGYNSSGAERLIRQDLCEEAIRLGGLILAHPTGQIPATHALMALMAFQAARFGARLQSTEEVVLLPDQNRSLWDRAMINQGVRWLASSADGDELSAYHLEAGIAAEHCLAATFAATNWTRILHLYDLLVRVQPSPVHALNRAIAISYLHGPQAGLNALSSISWDGIPKGYYLFDAALGELHRRVGHFDVAKVHLERALERTTSPFEQRLLRTRLAAANNCDSKTET